MSAAIATKVPKEPKNRSGLRSGTPAVKKVDALTIGGTPRVSLLPPEVHARKVARRLRRRLGFGLVGAVILVAAGMGLATVSLLASQTALAKAQTDATSLTSQQATYGAVTKIQLDSTSIKGAQKSATVKEIAWQPYIAALEKTLTPGMSISAIDASIDASAQSLVTQQPLQGPRIATLKLSVSSPQASISDWLDSLATLKGFVDETPGSVTLDGGKYKVDVVLHISDAALANRFTSQK
jgi:hypothetical protein